MIDQPTASLVPAPSADDTRSLPPLKAFTAEQLSAVPEVGTRYKLLEIIAEGGMGVIHRAIDTALSREVALKLIHAKHADNPYYRQRFLEESRITGQLQHPGIPPVHDLGTLPDGRPYLAMKLIKGVTLAELLKEKPSGGRKLAIFESICQALAYAHSKGVIHRDLKPQNVMVGAFGETQVMDWGLAKILPNDYEASRQRELAVEPTGTVLTNPREGSGDSNETEAGHALGTYAYMPPEQAVGAKAMVGPASDVFGLGAVLCEGLTGQPPYVGSKDEPTSFLAATGKLDDAFARIDACDVEAEMKAICKKCLSPNAKDRYANAGELAKAVADFRQASETRAREAEIAAIKTRQRRRYGAGLSFVLLVGAGVASVLAVRAERAKVREAEQREMAVDNGRKEADARRGLEAGKKDLDAKIASLSIATQFAADAAFAESRPARAKELLREVPVGLRGFEWHYRQNLYTGGFETFYEHNSGVSSVAFSPDGGRIVSGSADNTVKVWDAATGTERATLKGHTGWVNSVAFSPDGGRIVSGSLDKTVKVWDAATGAERATLKGHTNGVTSVAFSPDGGRIVSGSNDATVKVWDAATGAERATLKGHTGYVTGVAFSPDGGRIVSGSGDNTVKVWDAATGAERATLKGHTMEVLSVAFSPDGGRIVSGSGDKTVKVWDAATGAERATLNGHTGWVMSVAFSPDGGRIVSGSWDNTVKVWDAATGAERATLKGHTGWVSSVAFSPDGGRIVSGSGDKTVKVWDAATGAERATLKGHTTLVSSVAFSPDGGRIVSGSRDNTVKVWDAATGTERATLKGHTREVTSVVFSPDNNSIVSGSYDNTVKEWDAATGVERATLKGHTNGVTSVAFSPDGGRIVSGSWDNTVKVWDAATGAERATLNGHTGPVMSVAFSPNGGRIASGSADETVKVWDATTGAERATLKGHTGWVSSVAFSPDGGRIVSGSWDNTVKVWDAATGAEWATLKGHTSWVYGVAFSPDGGRIVSGSYDATVKVWDAATGAERATLKGHTKGVTSVAFSPDGGRIVSGSADNTVKVWDAATAQELDEKPDWNWQKLGRKHPSKPLWVHLEDDKPILINLEVSETELAYRRGKALFKPFEANEEYQNAKTTYAKAFWKGRFALNLPEKAEHWDAFRKECVDESTYRLMQQTCDLVLQKGPNERAAKEREWALGMLKRYSLEELPKPRSVE